MPTTYTFSIVKGKDEAGSGLMRVRELVTPKGSSLPPDSSASGKDVTAAVRAQSGLEGITGALLKRNIYGTWVLELTGKAAPGEYSLSDTDVGHNAESIAAADKQTEDPPREDPRRRSVTDTSGEGAGKPDSGKAKGGGGRSGSGGGGGGGDSEPEVAADPRSALQEFLIKHAEKYYNYIPSSISRPKGTTKDNLDDKIDSEKSSEWGEASKSALAGYCQFIKNRARSSDDRMFLLDEIGNITNALDSMAADGNFENWRGAKISSVDFSSDTSDLLRFLKLAYVATHPSGQTGHDAAKEIGLGPETSADYPRSKGWIAACIVGAITPFPFMTIRPPSGAKIVKDSTLTISDGNNSGTMRLGYDYPEGFIFGLGIRQNEMSPDNKVVADFFEPFATKIVGMIGKNATFTLKIGNRTWSAQNPVAFGNSLLSGAWVAGEVPPEILSSKQLSGETNTAGQNNFSRPGRTLPMKPQPIAPELQNVYLDSKGQPAINRVLATVEKQTPPNRDRWILRVQDPGNDVILVPVLLRQQPGVVSEAALHFAQILDAQETGAAPSNLAYVPMSTIEWVNPSLVTYGSNGLGTIELVEYDESGIPIETLSTKFPGIRIIGADDAIRQGIPGVGRDPLQSALANYISRNDNPVGTALFLSSNLNATMNQPSARGSGRTG